MQKLRLVGDRCAVAALTTWDRGPLNILNFRLANDSGGQLFGQVLELQLWQQQPEHTHISGITLHDLPFNLVNVGVHIEALKRRMVKLRPQLERFVPSIFSVCHTHVVSPGLLLNTDVCCC